LVNADGIDLLKYVQILKGKESKQNLIIASKAFGLEINAKKAKEVFVSHHY
jgi:hypothetical protein